MPKRSVRSGMNQPGPMILQRISEGISKTMYLVHSVSISGEAPVANALVEKVWEVWEDVICFNYPWFAPSPPRGNSIHSSETHDT